MATLTTKYDDISRIEFIDNNIQGDIVTIFLHGIGSGAELWKNQLNHLDGLRAIAWNAPGYGNSDQLDKTHPTALDYSARLNALIKSLAIQRINLIGHSLGALIACGFASQNPALIHQLILVNPTQGYGHSSEEKQEEIANLRPTLLQKLGGAEMARQRSSTLMHSPTEANIDLLALVMQKITLEGYQKSSRLLAHDSIHHYLPNIKITIPIIYGREDGITKPKSMYELNQRYANTILYGIDSAGHLSYLEQPQVFNRILSNIIQRESL